MTSLKSSWGSLRASLLASVKTSVDLRSELAKHCTRLFLRGFVFLDSALEQSEGRPRVVRAGSGLIYSFLLRIWHGEFEFSLVWG